MSDRPININKVRKARARDTEKARADANAVAFGLSKTEKFNARRNTARLERKLDGARLLKDTDGSDDTPQSS